MGYALYELPISSGFKLIIALAVLLVLAHSWYTDLGLREVLSDYERLLSEEKRSKTAHPGGTDNPDDAQHLREDR